MIIPQVYPSIVIGINISSGASITNFMCGSVGSSNIFLPEIMHFFGLMSDFYIRLTNHKPYRNSNITTYPESSENSVTLVQIVIFTCSEYFGRKETQCTPPT